MSDYYFEPSGAAFDRRGGTLLAFFDRDGGVYDRDPRSGGRAIGFVDPSGTIYDRAPRSGGRAIGHVESNGTLYDRPPRSGGRKIDVLRPPDLHKKAALRVILG
jgi:hypothetical protein